MTFCRLAVRTSKAEIIVNLPTAQFLLRVFFSLSFIPLTLVPGGRLHCYYASRRSFRAQLVSR